MIDSEVVISLAVFATIYGIFHLFVRRKERLALIEKGVDASIFKQEENAYPSLKYGLLFIGIAIGLFLGALLDAYTSLNDGVAYFASVFLFGGLGLLLYYYIAKARAEKE